MDTMISSCFALVQIILAMRFVSLTLENFQAHRKTVIEFDRSITVIAGQTDVGKSAVLRALRWVCLNDLSGEDFIRDGAKEAYVRLVFKAGKETHELVRRKGQDNEYWLNGKVYRAFGNSVPADIAALLNVKEINFQAQHDAPYWFSETAGEVSRQLNAIIDLDVIDTALSKVAVEVRKCQERKEISEERLAEIKKEYDEIKTQEQRIKDFDRLVETQDAYHKCQADYNTLLGLGNKIRDSRDTVKSLLDKSEDAARLLTYAQSATESNSDCKKLASIIANIQHYRAASEPPPDFTAVSKAFAEANQLQEDCWGLEELVGQIEKSILRYKDMQLNSYNAEKFWERATKGTKCPTCQRPL